MSLKEPGQESIQQGTTHFLYETRTQISIYYYFESYEERNFFYISKNTSIFSFEECEV